MGRLDGEARRRVECVRTCGERRRRTLMSASTERATMSGLHIAWVSDSPDTPSGFGNVTRAVCEGLARRGHRVTIFGWQTKRAFDWNGCRVLPMAKDPMGGDALYAYLLRHRPEAVIGLADVWWLPYFASPHVRRQLELTETPWILMTASGRWRSR